MNELGIDVQEVIPWFCPAQVNPYTLVRVSDQDAQAWAESLGLAVRRCYISDELLTDRAQSLGCTPSTILSAALPDPGSTMAGDFGEILVYIYGASKEHPSVAFGPKKWRLKQDRTKPAPHSDVLHFVLPTWPMSSADDRIICSEVKTKSTSGASNPISSAIADSAKDRTSRLARTLVWLRERAILGDLGDVNIEHLERFINATDHPKARKEFRAVAIICTSLLADELPDAPHESPSEYSVVIIAVPNLYDVYSSVYEKALESAAELTG